MHTLDVSFPSPYDEDERDPQEVDWQSLLAYYPGEQLLPNLRKFSSDNNALAQLYPFFIQPGLRNIFLTSCDIESIRSVIEGIYICSSTLQVLDIDEYYNHPQENPPPAGIIADMSRAISTLHSLTRVNIGLLSPEALDHLASLPYLRYLEFEAYDVEYKRPSQQPAFKILQELNIRTRLTDLSSLAIFLSNYAPPQLTDFSIHCLARGPPRLEQFVNILLPSARSVERVFTALANMASLRSVGICSHIPSSPPNDCITDVGILSKLFPLTQLSSLDLLHIPVSLSPGDAHQLATAWPRIVTLRLGDGILHYEGGLELNDLLPFANHCKRLLMLGVRLRVRNDDRYVNPPSFDQYGSPLRSLIVGGSSISFAPDSACFLACMFPRARIMSSYSSASRGQCCVAQPHGLPRQFSVFHTRSCSILSSAPRQDELHRSSQACRSRPGGRVQSWAYSGHSERPQCPGIHHLRPTHIHKTGHQTRAWLGRCCHHGGYG